MKALNSKEEVFLVLCLLFLKSFPTTTDLFKGQTVSSPTKQYLT